MSRDALTQEELYALAEHIQKGPHMVVPPGAVGVDYLIDSGFKITRTIIGLGPLHEYVLFRPATDAGPASLLPVVREFVWHFALDRERQFNDEPITWPALDVTYYQLNHDHMKALDEGFRALQTAAASLPIEANGLDLPSWYEDQSGAPSAHPSGPPVRKQVAFWANFGVELDFDGAAAPALDAAWEALWTLLSSATTPQQRLERCEEAYSFLPADFAYRIAEASPTQFI